MNDDNIGVDDDDNGNKMMLLMMGIMIMKMT